MRWRNSGSAKAANSDLSIVLNDLCGSPGSAQLLLRALAKAVGPHGERVGQIAHTQDFNTVLQISNDPALQQDLRCHLRARLELLSQAAQVDDGILFAKAVGEPPLLRQA